MPSFRWVHNRSLALLASEVIGILQIELTPGNQLTQLDPVIVRIKRQWAEHFGRFQHWNLSSVPFVHSRASCKCTVFRWFPWFSLHLLYHRMASGRWTSYVFGIMQETLIKLLFKSNHSPNIYTILLLLLMSMKLVVNRKKMTTSDEVTTFSIILYGFVDSQLTNNPASDNLLVGYPTIACVGENRQLRNAEG